MAEPTGFLGRWSQRKAAVAKGQAVDAPAKAPANAPAKSPARSVAPVPLDADPAHAPASIAAAPVARQPAREQAPVQAPALTLDDVKALTAESDFSPFAARGVAPEVKNAAMKKLFADPHYNVMDGLDIYIDDYSKADPLPESMLRQMVGAQFLKLFDDDPAPSGATTSDTDHAHADLRLQPNHAPGQAPNPGHVEPDSGPSPDAPQQPVPP